MNLTEFEECKERLKEILPSAQDNEIEVNKYAVYCTIPVTINGAIYVSVYSNGIYLLDKEPDRYPFGKSHSTIVEARRDLSRINTNICRLMVGKASAYDLC